MAGSPPHRPMLTFALLLSGALLQAAALSLQEIHSAQRKRGPCRDDDQHKAAVEQPRDLVATLAGMYDPEVVHKASRPLRALENTVTHRQAGQSTSSHLPQVVFRSKKGGASSSPYTRIFSLSPKTQKRSTHAPLSRPTEKKPAAAEKSEGSASGRVSRPRRMPPEEPAVLGELRAILRDEDPKRIPPDVKRPDPHEKKKRESEEPEEGKEETKTADKEAFKEWIRKEYYRNLARSFASMRRKRSDWSPREPDRDRADQFQEVADKLKTIENALLADALEVIRNGVDAGASTEKISNDLNAAYDLETMRIALAHLKDTLARMEEVDDEHEDTSSEEKAQGSERLEKKGGIQLSSPPHIVAPPKINSQRQHWSVHPADADEDANYPAVAETDSSAAVFPVASLLAREIVRRDGSASCPHLNLLISDCSALGDVMVEEPLRDLMLHACNWHEVCYSCGEVFGLTSEDCDVGFVEEGRTICQDDVQCQTAIGLLLVPLRQQRIFYKRSNPAVCYTDPCVLSFLRQD